MTDRDKIDYILWLIRTFYTRTDLEMNLELWLADAA